MKNILRLLENKSLEFGKEQLSFRIFHDGSGRVIQTGGRELFQFGNVEQLIKYLKS